MVALATLPAIVAPAPASLLGRTPAAVGGVQATTGQAATAHDFTVRDFRFQSGETLPEVRLHYRTIGTPRRDAAGRILNAVLVLHGSSGDANQVLAESFTGPLLGDRQPLDAAQHYLIFPDLLGNGRSTKPSDGLRARFPRYGYRDLVALEHRLVTEGLGIERLRLIIGISMGGMHAWMWGVQFPQAMDALIPIAAMPAAITGRNLLWRTILTQAIRGDPAWDNGNYAAQPPGFLAIMPMFDMLVQSPVRLDERIPGRTAAAEHLDAVREETLDEDDANNILYRFESSFDYDVAPDLGRIEAPVLSILFEDDELNPVETGTMAALMAKVKRGQLVIVPRGPETEGHRTQVKASVWREHLREFLLTVPSRSGSRDDFSQVR